MSSLEQDQESPSGQAIGLYGTVFELALAVVALALGWMLDVSPAATLRAELFPALIGLIATLPPLVAVWLVMAVVPWAFPRLNQIVDERVRPLFANCAWTELLAVAVAAGLGEELLFRGLLQGWLGEQIGPWGALVAASLAFGLCHALSPGYAILAGLMGVYLGALWLVTGNLLAPLIVHAAYDFAVLLYLQRRRRSPHSPTRLTER